jgi:hypothetical protein
MDTEQSIDTVTADDRRWSDIGLTYRRLDYWTRQGYLLAIGEVRPGSGRLRVWPVSEIEVADRMVRLTEVGLDLLVASELARYKPGTTLIVGRGITLVIA